MSDKAPKRRWFRFSLRTLFVVVTVFAVWLGLEVKFVRDRQAWMQANRALVRPGEPVPVGATVGMYIHSHATTGNFSFWRRWLGDAPVSSIVFPESWINNVERQNRVKRLFPEAELFQVSAIKP